VPGLGYELRALRQAAVGTYRHGTRRNADHVQKERFVIDPRPVDRMVHRLGSEIYRFVPRRLVSP